MDNSKLVLQAALDETKSKANINASIKRLQNQIVPLKIKVNLDTNAAKNIAAQVKAVANQKIELSNIKINSAQVGIAGQEIGRMISDEAGGQLSDQLNQIFTSAAKQTAQMAKAASSTVQTAQNTQSGKTDSGPLTALPVVEDNSSKLINTNKILIGVIQSVKDMFSNVYALDGSLLELSKTSGVSASGLRGITEEAFSLGESIGSTGKQVIDTVTEFTKAGYSLDSSMDMAEAALVMTNISDGFIQTSDAAGSLISILNGFHLSDSDITSVLDKMSSASKQSTIGLSDLSSGLERVAGIMNQAGNTVDQTIGLLTGGFSQLGDIDKVSEGMLLIQQRLQGIDENGKTIEGLSAMLQNSFGEIGISVENADGSLRSMYEIAADYAAVLPDLTEKQKQYFGELAAGSGQTDVWNAMTEQFADVETAASQSFNSIGSAAAANETYVNSITGKVELFKGSFEQLSNTVLNSDLLKFFIDLGTVGVKSIDGIVNTLTPLGALGAGAGITAFIKNLDYQKVLKIA